MQRHAACKGCPITRNAIQPAWPSCKGKDGPLCKLVDITTIVHLKKHLGRSPSIEEVVQADALITNNWLNVSQRVWGTEYPRDFDEFVDFAIYCHAMLYRGSNFHFAGRFRVKGEPVFYGGREGSERIGLCGSMVRDALRELHSEAFQPRERWTENEVIANAAMFLHTFFSVHPFVDGNGRIGRLFLELAARSTSQFRFLPFSERDMNSERRRKYIKALRYADKREDGRAAGRYRRLEAWLSRYLRPWSEYEEVEVEPPGSSARFA